MDGDDVPCSQGVTPMDPYSGPANGTRRADRDLELILPRGDSPVLGAGAVTQDRTGTAGKQGSYALPVAVELWPADRVHTRWTR